jgi:hypothetical protein
MMAKFTKWVIENPRRFFFVMGILMTINGIILLKNSDGIFIEIFSKINIAMGFFSVGMAITNIIPPIEYQEDELYTIKDKCEIKNMSISKILTERKRKKIIETYKKRKYYLNKIFIILTGNPEMATDIKREIEDLNHVFEHENEIRRAILEKVEYIKDKGIDKKYFKNA